MADISATAPPAIWRTGPMPGTCRPNFHCRKPARERPPYRRKNKPECEPAHIALPPDSIMSGSRP